MKLIYKNQIKENDFIRYEWLGYCIMQVLEIKERTVVCKVLYCQDEPGYIDIIKPFELTSGNLYLLQDEAIEWKAKAL